jgi:hypothetical protein
MVQDPDPLINMNEWSVGYRCSLCTLAWMCPDELQQWIPGPTPGSRYIRSHTRTGFQLCTGSRIRNTAFCMCADTSWNFKINTYYLVNFSVADSDPNPDPGPPDTHVFGPPGSGSISQRHGSADPDPDPHQNVMDPQHWLICYEIQAKNDVLIFTCLLI